MVNVSGRATLPKNRAAGSSGQQRNPSSRSLHGLDGLNFLMADVRDGLGPYLAIFLKGGQHWGSGEIGIVMAASSLAAAVSQIPAGLLVDGLKIKRALIATSGLLIAASCLLIAFFPKLPVVLAAQVMLGAASAIIPPALAALSLGIVGRRLLPELVSGATAASAVTAAGLRAVTGVRAVTS